jgi:hypothetical protein
VLAARGKWVTNEKRLLERAGLRSVDGIVAGLSAGPDELAKALESAEDVFASALSSATRAPCHRRAHRRGNPPSDNPSN